MTFMALIGPMLGRLLVWGWERLISHYKSSFVGVGIGATVAGAMQLFGCDTALMNSGVVAALVAAPKLLGTDADKVGPTLWAAVTEAVEQQKKSDRVLSEAQALQDQSAKEAGMMKVWIPILCIFGLAGLTACSAAQLQKDKQIIATIKADGKTIVVTGCKDLPTIEILASFVPEFYPPSAAVITVGEKYADAFCAKVKAVAAPVPAPAVAPVPVS